MSDDAVAPRTGTRLLEEWFVKYNPFYVASAALTLSGAWQLSLGIAERGWQDGRILPSCVLGVYQLLLAAACVAVARKGTIRPAVILALVSTLFTVDPTLQNTQIALHASRGVGLLVAAALVALLGGITVRITRALDITLNRSAYALLFGTASGIAAGPHLLDSAILPTAVAYLLLVAGGAIITAIAIRYPVVIDVARTDAWTSTVARRAGRYLNALFPASFIGHLIGWANVFEPVVDWRAAVVVALTVMVFARHEQSVWVSAIAVLVIAMNHPAHASAVLLPTALLLLLRWRLSHRMLAGALILSWLAAASWNWAGGPLPDAPAAVTLAVSALLVALCVRQRTLVPLLPLVFMAWKTKWGFSDLDPMSRGIVLLASGFLLLAAGFIANLFAKPVDNAITEELLVE